MPESSVVEPPHRLWVGPVLVRAKDRSTAGWHDASQQLLYSFPRGLWIRPPVLLFENRASDPLRGSHRATSAKFCVVEAVHIVRGAHQEIQVEGPVLAVLEAAESVQYERFAGRASGTQSFMEQKTMSAEVSAQALDRTVRNVHLAGDLPESGACNEAVEERVEEVRSAQPVAGRKGLRTEVPATMMTAVPLNPVRLLLATEETLLLEAPRL